MKIIFIFLMVIGHYKQTPIAHAPDAISDIINKYTHHSSYVFGGRLSIRQPVPQTNIIHLHNKDNTNHPKKIIQYHSEPQLVELNVPYPKLVIAQYHASLPEYSHCRIVRNPIDIFKPVFIPKYNDKKIRIGYSPSNIVATSVWADKGYVETMPILQKLQKKYKDKIEIDVITDVSLPVCLQRKSLCNIIIDEVKTGSYHRSALEGLAMGQVVICSISEIVEKIMLTAANAPNQPFVNVYYPKLFDTLCDLIDTGIMSILMQGWNSRYWMEKYWHPEVIANEYISIYESL